MSTILLLISQLIQSTVCASPREVFHLCRETWNKNEAYCTPTPPEDFKYCVTQKRRPLPAPCLGFKSISCQCHTTPGTTGVRIQTRWVQTYRQCLFTDEDVKEEPSEDKGLELFKACKVGNVVAVKHVISHQPEKLTAKDQEGHTPLMVSAWNGQTRVFNYLACLTWNCTALNKYNDTLLHIASYGGSADIVKRVLSLRLFDIDMKGEDKRTPVLLAIRFGHTDVAELLIQAGCNLMLVDRLQHNILHLASKSENMGTLKFVLALHLFSLESRQAYGMTPLLLAANRGFLDGCKYLIQEGADVTAVDNDGKTLLHQVIKIKRKKEGRLHLMRYILSKGYVNKESKGKFGETPLLLAARNGDVELFQLLVDEGCDRNAVDKDGNSVLHLATQFGKYSIVSHILHKQYVSPMRRSFSGITALMAAAYTGYVDIFTLLFRHGANMTDIDEAKRNVFHWACSGGHIKMIRHIVSITQVEIDAKDGIGYTPLMYSVRNGHVPAFKFLKRKGCSTKLRNIKGDTILHLACRSGSENMVKLLIKLNIAKIYIHEKNIKGKTPKQSAEEDGFRKIVKLLNDLSRQ